MHPSLSINARILPGLGAAAAILGRQLPLIAREFPEVAACHPGSINVEFDVPLVVLAPDHRTRPLVWYAGQPVAEVFDLLRIGLQAPAEAQPVEAWLYIAHDSPHRRTPHVHEIITTRLDLRGVSACRVTIPRQAFQLPWPQFPMVMMV